jgi:hypothetical protein
MAAMSIYKALRRTEPFGVSFRGCDSKDAGVGSCDQFLADLSLRDCSVYTQRAYAIGLAHFFGWLHASGGDPDHVTRQIVGRVSVRGPTRLTARIASDWPATRDIGDRTCPATLNTSRCELMELLQSFTRRDNRGESCLNSDCLSFVP